MIGPTTGSGGQSAMLGAKPPQAGERKMFPSPEAPKMDAPSSFTPDTPGAVTSALRGFGGEGGGSGILGAIGNMVRSSDEADRQRTT